MNCPKCGRPLSEKANICPRCKEKIYHNNENAENRNEDGTMKPLTVDEKPLKRNRSPWVTLLIIVVIIIVAIAICCLVVPDKVVMVTEKVKFLDWLTKLLKK